MEKIFSSVKIACPPEGVSWDVEQWVEHYIDKSLPFLVVKHLHGKKEEPHWHVVGKAKPGVGHLTLDQSLGAPHPMRGTEKPFQKKRVLYDADHFPYLVKEVEWEDQGHGMVVTTSFSEEEVEALAEKSKEYVVELKKAIPDLIAALPIERNGREFAAHDFHARAVQVAWQHLVFVKKQPGPWLTHMVRQCVYIHHERYQEYITDMYM